MMNSALEILFFFSFESLPITSMLQNKTIYFQWELLEFITKNSSCQV